MSRDGLLPRIFSRVHPRFRTPDFSTWVAGFVVGIPAGLLDIGTLADLSNIGTLFAFALVAGGVLILRYREPDRPACLPCPRWAARPDRDDSDVLAADGGAAHNELDAIFRVAAIGLVIYHFYGRKHSELSTAAESAGVAAIEGRCR